MRRIVVAMCAVSFGTIMCSANVHAQATLATPRYPFVEMRDSLFKGIALTDSQKVKVETIARGYWELIHANDARMRGAPRDSALAFMRELREKQTMDLRRLLSPTQQKKFDENRGSR